MKSGISVIVPYRNAAGTLRDAVSSVLEQTDPDWELLLVDSASTDEGPAIAASLAAEDRRIRLLSAGEGVSAARNHGIDSAHGSYLTFLDADDTLEPEFLATLREEAAASGADFAGCGFRIAGIRDEVRSRAEVCSRSMTENRDSDGGPGAAGRRSTSGSEDDPDAESYIESGAGVQWTLMTPADFLREGILGNDTRVWSKLFRRELIGSTRFREDLSIGEDTVFVLELLERARRIACTGRQMYRYYSNPDGAIEKPFTESYFDQIRCWEIMEQWADVHKDLFRGAGIAGYEPAGGGQPGGVMPQPGMRPEGIFTCAPEEITAVSDEKGNPPPETPVRVREEIRARFAARKAVGILLTASKLACADSSIRRKYDSRLREMRQKLLSAMHVPGMKQYLLPGYGAKAALFSLSPRLYCVVYGRVKRHRVFSGGQRLKSAP